MTIQEVARIYKRICKNYTDRCYACPLDLYGHASCTTFIIDEPDQAEKILLEWEANNPVPTNRDKFFEMFGDRKYKQFGCKKVCEPTPCCDCDWWNKEYVEPEKGGEANDEL